MSDEPIEKEPDQMPEGAELNADAIAEVFGDEHHAEEEDDEHFYAAKLDEDDDDGDVMDTNFEIMNDDKNW
jgi:hypothetical protein